MLAAVKFGDPLLIEGRFGKGRVMVCTTTLGRKWNNFGAKGEFNYNFHVALQEYLTSQNQEAELIVGQPLDIYMDATRYDTKMRRLFKPEVAGNAANPNAAASLEDLGEQQQTGTPPRAGCISASPTRRSRACTCWSSSRGPTAAPTPNRSSGRSRSTLTRRAKAICSGPSR